MSTVLSKNGQIKYWSKFAIKTLRESPNYADTPGYQYLVRAGFFRPEAAGIFTMLPFALNTLAKIEAIIRDEINKIGGVEVSFPALLPREPYETTNRWIEYGDNLFKFKDRKKGDYLLAPTHEEMFTLLAKEMLVSYKDFPSILYQIQTKYRDEARPRAGVIRGREFIMKDSYSFDLGEKELEESYLKHRQAYLNIFNRLGLKVHIVQAQSGAMGGSKSEEFLLPCEIGEDTFILTPSGYAANVEAFIPYLESDEKVDYKDLPKLETIDTPNTKTVEQALNFLNDLGYNYTRKNSLKNVVYKINYPQDEEGKQKSELVDFVIPGNRDVDLKRVEAQLSNVEIVEATEGDFKKVPELIPGYIGPHQQFLGVRYIIDRTIKKGDLFFTGANQKDQHVVNLVYGRDFEIEEKLDLINVLDGDLAYNKEPVTIQRGIELGHIFQLGYKYSNAFNWKIQNQEGKAITPIMGSYGIGVTRILAAYAETNHDEKGLIWSPELTPFDFEIVQAIKDEKVDTATENIIKKFSSKGYSIFVDDRDVSTGVKFKDAELIGFNQVIVLGNLLKEHKLELKSRQNGSTEVLSLDQLYSKFNL